MARITAQVLKQSLLELGGDLVQLRRSQEITNAAFQMAKLPSGDLERLAAIINVFAAGKHPMDMTPAEFNQYLGAQS